MPVYTKGKYYYCVYYDGSHRVWEPCGKGEAGKKKATERDLEIKYRKTRDENTQRIQAHPHSIRFNQLLQLYVDDRADLADSTINDIIGAMTKHFSPVVGTMPVDMITPVHAKDIESKMIASGLSARTINKSFRYANRIFDWVIWSLGTKMPKGNPWSDRLPLRQKKFQIELFSINEFAKILLVAEEHLRWAMEVEYYTGMRPGPTELFAVRWDDIDWKKNRLSIYGQKTDNRRWQYLPGDFMAKLRERYENRDCEYIVSYQGRRITSNLKKSWTSAKQKAGITKRIRLYDIRHFYISYALAGGADIAELAERVGNTPETISRHYWHLAKQLRGDEAFIIPNLFDATNRVKVKIEHNSRTNSRTKGPTLRLVKG